MNRNMWVPEQHIWDDAEVTEPESYSIATSKLCNMYAKQMKASAGLKRLILMTGYIAWHNSGDGLLHTWFSILTPSLGVF
jgi:hypothetical protein